MNRIDALDRSWDDHFNVPIAHRDSIESLDLYQHGSAIHVIDSAHEAFNIAFYAQFADPEEEPSSEKELVVSLHGAATGPLRYPQFRRVESLKGKALNLLSFADPTLQYSRDSDFRIGWYIGGRDWDPLTDIAKIVQTAMRTRGYEHVAFLGSSAGGHAALRISTMFDGSLAFVMDPQTDVAKYYWPSRNRMFENGWPGTDLKEAMGSSVERTDLTRLYKKLDPSNYIYYRQSLGDPWHMRVHAKPFEAAVAQLQGVAQKRFQFVYEAGEKEGHGKITASEFDRHYIGALNHWRESRACQAC